MNGTSRTWLPERLPMPPLESLDAAQRAAADALINSPRKGVKGPFIPLMQRPALLGHVAALGAWLRFDSPLPRRLNEFATLVVSRHYSQQFEWATHVPLALAAGTLATTIDALAEGRRPDTMDADETLVHDFVSELLVQKGVSDGTWQRTRERFGEPMLVDLVMLTGYFAMVSLLLNTSRTPPEPGAETAPLPPLPGA